MMSVSRVDESTEIKSGQWINKESIFSDGICGRPRMAVKTSGQRVYYTNKHGEDEGEYCLRRLVKFVSDSKQEADEMYQLSESKELEISNSRKLIVSKYKLLISDRLEKP